MDGRLPERHAFMARIEGTRLSRNAGRGHAIRSTADEGADRNQTTLDASHSVAGNQDAIAIGAVCRLAVSEK